MHVIDHTVTNFDLKQQAIDLQSMITPMCIISVFCIKYIQVYSILCESSSLGHYADVIYTDSRDCVSLLL